MIVKYPDGTSYANVGGENYARIVKRINSYEDLWHLGQILESANHNGSKPNVIIPCLFDAQADRRFHKEHSSGLKMVCNFLNSFDVTSYKVFDPHNPEVVEALLNKVEIIPNSLFVRKALNKFMKTHSSHPTVLMSPDAGAYKKLMATAQAIGWEGEVVAASKSRRLIHGKSMLTQQMPSDDLNNKNVLIVDDLCVYGGTFKGLSEGITDKYSGVVNIGLAVSHITMQNHQSVDPVFNFFDNVYTTNSKFENYYMSSTKGEPFTPDNLDVFKFFIENEQR